MCIAPRPTSQRISKLKKTQHSYLSHDLGPKWKKPLDKRSRKPPSRDAPSPQPYQVASASSSEATADQVIASGSTGESPIIQKQEPPQAPAQPIVHNVASNDAIGSSATTKSTKAAKPKADEKEKGPRYWTPAEHQKFLEALEKFHFKDNKSISEYVGTRSATQVRTHAQKYFIKLAAVEAEKVAAMVTGTAETNPVPPVQPTEPNAPIANMGIPANHPVHRIPIIPAAIGNTDVFSELRDVLSGSGRATEAERSTFDELACDLLCDSEEDLLSVSVTEDDLRSVSQTEGYDSDGSCQNDANELGASSSSSMAVSTPAVEAPLQSTWGCQDLLMDIKHMHDLQDLMEIDDSW